MFYIIFLTTLLIDQASKATIMKTMSLNESIPVVAKIFHITYIHNPGAAFGLLADRTSVFITVSLLVVGGLFVYQLRGGMRGGLMPVAMGLIAGGAMGNLLDRLRFGFVVDFLDFRVWPVFNLADSAIVIGAFLVAFLLWRAEEKS